MQSFQPKTNEGPHLAPAADCPALYKHVFFPLCRSAYGAAGLAVVCSIQQKLFLAGYYFEGERSPVVGRINPGKPLVCRAINLCGVALPEGTHAHIQTQVHNNTRDYQCCQVVWSEGTICLVSFVRSVWWFRPFMMIVFVSEVINVLRTTPQLLSGPLLTQLIYALKRCP